jgi:hypothetical protein
MNSGLVALFSLTAFLAAFLLFSVQPMIGKMVLPLFGGAPAVWNTCLVYYQVMLLLGYALSGDLPVLKAVERRRVSVLFLTGLAGLLVLGYWVQPVRLMAGAIDPAEVSESPVINLLRVVCLSTALPLLLLSATSPMVQHWFAGTRHPRARDPYFLYAASNSGSFLALVSYPFAIEPNLSLTDQARFWRTGFLVLAVLMMACGAIARRMNRRGKPRSGESGELPCPDDLPELTRPARSARLQWLGLVFVPSSWLMSVTTYVTTDLAAIPLLWVIPLALYLLSFIIAFSGSLAGLVRLAERALPFLVVPLALVMMAGFVHALWLPLHLLTFFVGAIACHGALARQRPAARHLSTFYVTIALGGLLGGVFNALIAPVLFTRVVEYPMTMVLACLVVPGLDGRLRREGREHKLGIVLLAGTVFLLAALLTTNQAGLAESVLGVIGVMVASGLGFYACMTAQHRPIRFAMVVAAVLLAGGLAQGPGGRLLHIERNFFGVVRVTEDPVKQVRRLFHGSTLHGAQSLDPVSSREPLTYFTRSGPIGQLFSALGPRLNRPETQIGVVGLGVGTLRAYAGPYQHWTFYELDPAVLEIYLNREPRYFTYSGPGQPGDCRVVEGDARLRLRHEPDHVFALIVLDAFSSDALPVHLLTREAIQLYESKLAQGGVLAFNLSTRYLDLEPVIGRQAQDAGLDCRINYDTLLSPAEWEAGKQPSIWAVMAATDFDLGALAHDARWRLPTLRPNARVWTDDYSDLARYLRWMPRPLTRRRDGHESSAGIEPEPAR